MGFRGFARFRAAHHTRGSDRARRSRRAPARAESLDVTRSVVSGAPRASTSRSRRTSPRSSPATSACGASWSPFAAAAELLIIHLLDPHAPSLRVPRRRPRRRPGVRARRVVAARSPTPRDRAGRRGSRASGRDPARGRTRLGRARGVEFGEALGGGGGAGARDDVRRGGRAGCAVGAARARLQTAARGVPFAGRARGVGWPPRRGHERVVGGGEGTRRGSGRSRPRRAGFGVGVLGAPREVRRRGRRRVNAESLERTSRRSSLVLAVRFSAATLPYGSFL